MTATVYALGVRVACHRDYSLGPYGTVLRSDDDHAEVQWDDSHFSWEPWSSLSIVEQYQRQADRKATREA
jgi:hypothetical protein